jgi:hypothetical protein
MTLDDRQLVALTILTHDYVRVRGDLDRFSSWTIGSGVDVIAEIKVAREALDRAMDKVADVIGKLEPVDTAAA